MTKAVLCSKIKYKALGKAMRSNRVKISLLLISIGMGVVLFYGLFEEPPPGLVGDHHGLTKPTVVSRLVVPGGEPKAERPQTNSGFGSPGEALPPVVKKEGGAPVKAPVQVTKLVKCKNLEAVVKKYARRYGVDEDLIWAVMHQESGFNPGAVSPKGAMGLMQLMPGTAALLGVSDPFDVEQNIAGGVKYLEQCLNQFNQDVPMALAAYNAGPANVVKYQGCPPFTETRNYVASILAAYAGESIQVDLKLFRVNYLMEEDEASPASVRPNGLPWRIPLPSWKIATPQSKLGSPHWKVTLRPF